MAKKKTMTSVMVRESLMEQLRIKCADGKAYYVDLVDEYMRLWGLAKSLRKDIKSRGVVYEEMAATGKVTLTKSNPSVKELLNVNRQMLSILDNIGLTPLGNCEDDFTGMKL